MKKVVYLAMLLAAIVPSVSCFSAQKAEYGRVGKVKPSPLAMRRIEIDADKVSIEGNYGWWLQEHLPALIRKGITNSGLAGIAISGRQFQAAAESLDRIHNSGYYSQESRCQVPKGQMVAPTDQYKITGVANIDYKNRGGNFSLGGKNINLSDTKLNARVRLVIEPVDLRTGLNTPSYESKGEAARSTNRNASVYGYPSYADVNSAAGSVEDELLVEAAEKAVNDFIRQFNPEPLEAPAIKPAPKAPKN